jgi:D-3-phosphoglycerate dehydrogenase
MSHNRVFIADKLPETAKAILESAEGVDVTMQTGRSEEELCGDLQGVHGLIVRSATQVTAPLLEAAGDLKAVIRAGVGVDNIDIEACTRRGVVVMNVPAGNTVSAAEHTIAILLSLARRVPEADRSMKAGEWNRKLQGTELQDKTLGLIGCGRVGREVATRLLAFRMNVVIYDPFLTDEAAGQLGAKRVELEELIASADVISLHAPLTDATRNILNAERIGRLRDGCIVVNCARGGLVDEAALAAAIEAGTIRGAAFDVFASEPPAPDNPLTAHAGVVATPHLGASTAEAQDRVGRQAAAQMIAFLNTGAPLNAINAPAVPAELLPRLDPYFTLARRLGALLAQHAESAPRSLDIEYHGAVLELPVEPITAALAGGYLEHLLGRPVPPVSARLVAKERELALREIRSEADGDYTTLIEARLTTEQGTHEAAGTLFGRREPRLVRLDGYEMDARPEGHLLLVSNDDRSGMLGHICGAIGTAGLNIAECAVGRDEAGGRAMAVLNLDQPVDDALASAIAAGDGILRVRRATLA